MKTTKRSVLLTILAAAVTTAPIHEASAAANRCRDAFSGERLASDPGAASLLPTARRAVELKTRRSPGVSDPLIAEARDLKTHHDFKFLSDLRRKPLSKRQADEIEAHARAEAESAPPELRRKKLVTLLIERLYDSGTELIDAPVELTRPKFELESPSPSRRATFATIERTWKRLVKLTPVRSEGSLIPLPHPVIIPGSRFQESYYWDSYFGNKALLRTGREDLAAMQVENFVFMIRNYGLVPNGMRDYYLSRSQPPLIASMARDVAETFDRKGKAGEVRTWLANGVYEAIAKDYRRFWMNPGTRFDRATGLNHHWDAKNTPREERHSSDKEEELGATYRDVRAEAESGKDFTDAYGGETTRIAPVLLNSVLYKAEIDLAWMARRLGRTSEANEFEAAARLRKAAVDRHLWDPVAATYKEFHLDRNERLPLATADVFVPLWAGLASKDQAAGVRAQLRILEANGGVLASEVTSGKQWDAPYGWAPQQYFAMAGLKSYGYATDARRIGEKWATTVERIHDQLGVLIEKVDVVRADKPIETGDKYETQEGFLWTNAVYVWTMTDVLGLELRARRPARPAKAG